MMLKTDKTYVLSQIESLEKKFSQFRDKNEPFLWDTRIVDKEGYEVTILVDFGASDYERDICGMAYVWTVGENNPCNNVEKIRNSEAFQKASEIVEKASREIAKDGYPDCEFNVIHEGDEIVVENSYTIFLGE